MSALLFREHPLDTVYTVGLINLPAFLLGFPLETLAGFIAFHGIWAIYIHSNVRLPIGRSRAPRHPQLAPLAPRPCPGCQELGQLFLCFRFANGDSLVNYGSYSCRQ